MNGGDEGLAVCPACRVGHLHPETRIKTFTPRGARIEVELETSVCDQCGTEKTSAAQHRENLRALAERKQHYGEAMMGEEILALRKRYGITQQQASEIFGKGKIAFSRYETETTYPDESTTALLWLAAKDPGAMKRLADRAGVALPLWEERCEDERRIKLRPMPPLPASAMRQSELRAAGQSVSAQFDWAANEAAA
jgi:putative zinc finger/helix-turn-helix YgiT family protein